MDVAVITLKAASAARRETSPKACIELDYVQNSRL